ncbi:MAG: hypothetical protein HYY25_07930 [Candidatus Wallbacteria bacterium]|nr:hypothetical protein [Candidatus Wallbacteria bacterium]
MNPNSAFGHPAGDPFMLTTMDVVNWVLVLVVCLFLFQLLQEMLFRQRGKYCTGCGLRDLPRNWSTCEICGMSLGEYVERVTPFERRVSYGFPVVSVLVSLVAYHQFERVTFGGPLVVLGFIIVNSCFAQLWLPRRDARLRTLYNVPFWGTVAMVLFILLLDASLRARFSAGGPGAVADLELEADGSLCMALRDGTVSHGIGPVAYPYMRSVPIKRLLRSGTGELFLYGRGSKLTQPDAILSARGLQWSPAKNRSETGVQLLLGTATLSALHRTLLDRSTHQPNVTFCLTGDRVWVCDGQQLFRIQPDGTTDVFSLGKRQLGRLIKVVAGDRMVWLFSANGLTGISTTSERKTWYPLMELAAREGQPAAQIVAGALKGEEAWLATSGGDVLRFDLDKERLSFQGVAQCPKYLDFYNLYTLPILVLALGWMLAANFREEGQ